LSHHPHKNLIKYPPLMIDYELFKVSGLHRALYLTPHLVQHLTLRGQPFRFERPFIMTASSKTNPHLKRRSESNLFN
jgi:hypothetical protein